VWQSSVPPECGIENSSEIADHSHVSQNHRSELKAVLGPTNTGKTHYAVERLCAHSSGIIGFPLRLLAREVYDRVVSIKGAESVGLITGEERILPPKARWLLCTAESMPLDRDVAFIALDEAQLGVDADRGHVFTDRLLNVRGREETLILGSASLKPLVKTLLPEADIVSRPRFSQLSYAGPKKLHRLPPRTAIIAFSADEVYAIAEQVRRNCGGAAIVMGGLSPRTRNAQIAMYQAGEVDYIVATDAIGMGLNMDVNHVAFASLKKFDGARHRRLAVHEMAQIAGRAGRHQRDGSFGIALSPNDSPEFSQEEIDRIEEHRFAPNHWLFWRNTALNFQSPDALIESLEIPPPHPELRPSPEADDKSVLRSLISDAEIMALARGEARVRRLWDACGLPDFRSTGPDFHARLVARLYRSLATGHGRIPDQLIADEVVRLDSVQGNVAALSSRLASIRTWTYVANRADWLNDPAHWSGRTREVEEKLSDALHRQLTERFVDRRATRLHKDRGKVKLAGDLTVDSTGKVEIFDEPIGRMSGFRLISTADARNPDVRKLLGEAEARLPAIIAARINEFAEAKDGSIQLMIETGKPVRIMWRGGNIGHLVRGRGLLTPNIELDQSAARLDPNLREKVQSRTADYVKALIHQRLRPLVNLTHQAFSSETPPELRATLAPIAEAGGLIARHSVEACLTMLTLEQRRQIRSLGLTIGALSLFHPALLKPEASRLAAALRAIRSNKMVPPLPMPGMTLLDRPNADLAFAAEACGYYRFGDQMLRYDILERIATGVHNQRKGFAPFEPDLGLASSLGVGTATLDRVLKALGFVSLGNATTHTWRWRGMRKHTAGPFKSNAVPFKVTSAKAGGKT
jgi:ATP-dependent RNA helicase SUPV3L1/SUV3